MRLCGDDIVEAKMVAGPAGFAVACFGKEEFETETPNLLLEASKPVMKRPSVLKDPATSLRASPPAVPEASAGEEDELEDSEGVVDPEEPEDPEDPEEESLDPESLPSSRSVCAAASSQCQPGAVASATTPRTYHKMFYKSSNKYGIRQKFFSHQQIFQFDRSGMPREILDRLAQQVLDRLHSGMGEKEAGEWVKRQVSGNGEDLE